MRGFVSERGKGYKKDGGGSFEEDINSNNLENSTASRKFKQSKHSFLQTLFSNSITMSRCDGPSFTFGPGGPHRRGTFPNTSENPFTGHPLFSLLSDLPNITSDPTHPLSQFLSQHGIHLSRDSSPEEGFEPNADIFNTKDAFLIHVELPGAQKEDLGISYDSDADILEISGVVYRRGDEEAQKGLVKGERRVGLFSKKVQLLGGKKVRINSEKITARLEGGVLEVVVPKEEWVDVGEKRRVVVE